MTQVRTAPPGMRARLQRVKSELVGQNPLLLYPLVALVCTLILVPVGLLLYGAVWSAPPTAVGGAFTLGNLRSVFLSTALLRPFLNSLAIGITVGAVSVLVGCVLAWLVTRTDLPRAALWENLLVIPLYLSPLMLTLSWIGLAAPNTGFLNALSAWLGGPGSPFNIYTFTGMVVVLASHYGSYAFLYLLGPMRAINSSLEEAAMVLGSSRWTTLRRIILPLLLPAIFASLVMVATLAVENFAVPVLLGRRIHFNTLPSEMYAWLTYEPSKPNLAAAAGIPLFLITLCGVMIYRYMVRLSVKYVTVSGKSYNIRRLQLGRWRWVASLGVSAYFTVALVIPMVGLLFGSLLRFITPKITWSLFTLANYEQVFKTSTNLLALKNSILLCVVGATLTTLLGAIVSYAVQRSKHRLRGSLEYVSSMSVALPGIVLGIGMMWTYVRVPAVYATLWVLLIAYVTRFLAHSVRITGASLLQVSSELDEAAQVAGAGLLRRWKDVVFPLIGRGMLSAWVLLFIFILNEVSTTIVLYSSRTVTISVLVWQSLDMYGSIQAFAFSFIQSILVFIALTLVYRLYGRVGDPTITVE